jgi:hypothetical protein
MIAEKMEMTIRGTSQAAMVLTPAEFNDQVGARDTPIWKRLGHVAQLMKNVPSVLEDSLYKIAHCG